MDFQFVGEHMDLTESLKNYARKRVGKLEKFFPERPDQEINARVKLIMEDKRPISDIQINGDGKFFEGKAEGADMYSSIDMAVDKLGRQLRKYHDKKTNHRKKNNSSRQRQVASKVLEMQDNGDDNQPNIIRRKTFTAKPMTTEEAVLQMNSLDYEFLVFTNQVTNDVNVVYRRDDGNYGLIEAET